jgi:DNA-binding MarR family transcriptional regulator
MEPSLAERRAANPDPLSTLDQASVFHLVGYHVARADAGTRTAYTRHVGRPLGLTPVEFTALMLLRSNASVTQKQLAQTLAVTAANITILTDRLCEKGWVVRSRDDGDRRLQFAQLTDEGRGLADRAYELSLSCERELLGALSEGERAMLVELLVRLAHSRKP